MPLTRSIGQGRRRCWAMRRLCLPTWKGCTHGRRRRRRSNPCSRNSGRGALDRQARAVAADKKKPAEAGFFPQAREGGLRHLHLVRLHALRALDGDEGDLLAFLQRLEPVALDGAEMDEQVVTAFGSDEAETLGIVEPFDCTALAIRHDT